MTSYGPSVRVVRSPADFSLLQVQARVSFPLTVDGVTFSLETSWKAVRVYDERSYGFATTDAARHPWHLASRLAIHTHEGNPSACTPLDAPECTTPVGARATPDNIGGDTRAVVPVSAPHHYMQ